MRDQHKRFADEYLIDMNASAAYLRAGYTSKNPDVDGHRLLVKPSLQAYIQERIKDREKRTEILQDRVLQEFARLSFFDPRKLFNADGSPMPINDLDDDTAAAITGLDVLEEWEGAGKDRKFVGHIKKYRIVDKKGALDSVARHLGMFKDEVKMTGGLVIFKGEEDLKD